MLWCIILFFRWLSTVWLKLVTRQFTGFLQIYNRLGISTKARSPAEVWASFSDPRGTALLWWLELGELKGSQGVRWIESQTTLPSSPNHHTPTTVQIFTLPEVCLWCLFKLGQLSLRRGINSKVHILWSLARRTLAEAMMFEWLFTSTAYSRANMFFALSACICSIPSCHCMQNGWGLCKCNWA